MRQMNGEKIRKYNRISKKKKKLTRHHNKARSLGGTYDTWNIYKLSSEHHQAYHKLFGLMDFDQAAKVLLRMQDLHNEGLST